MGESRLWVTGRALRVIKLCGSNFLSSSINPSILASVLATCARTGLQPFLFPEHILVGDGKPSRSYFSDTLIPCRPHCTESKGKLNLPSSPGLLCPSAELRALPLLFSDARCTHFKVFLPCPLHWGLPAPWGQGRRSPVFTSSAVPGTRLFRQQWVGLNS